MSQHWHKLFVAVSAVTLGVWAVLIALFAWWAIEPARLPTVTQPLPILNPNHEVAIGDPIVLEVAVVKTVPRDAEKSTRWLECGGGNLVTLTPTPAQTIPVGTNQFISNSIILPNKVTPGNVCTVHWAIRYHINPYREETLELVSEEFTVTTPNHPEETLR